MARNRTPGHVPRPYRVNGTIRARQIEAHAVKLMQIAARMRADIDYLAHGERLLDAAGDVARISQALRERAAYQIPNPADDDD
jgi:hypothetical protein